MAIVGCEYSEAPNQVGRLHLARSMRDKLQAEAFRELIRLVTNDQMLHVPAVAVGMRTILCWKYFDQLPCK